MGEQSSIEKIIKSDPHVVRVEHGESWEFHEIDYSLFKSKRDRVEMYVKGLQKFLGSPYIIDDFQDHFLRERWRMQKVPEKYDKEVKEFVRSNSLRRASYLVVNNCRDVINGENYTGTNREMFESKLKDMLDGVAEIRKATEGVRPTPITLVKSLKQKVYELLEFLSYQSPAY